MRLKSQHIAFVPHGRVEGQMAASQHGLPFRRAAAQQSHLVSRLRFSGSCQSSILRRLLKIARGKLVFRLAARHVDRYGCRQRGLAGEARFARGRKQPDLGCGEGRKRGQQSKRGPRQQDRFRQVPTRHSDHLRSSSQDQRSDCLDRIRSLYADGVRDLPVRNRAISAPITRFCGDKAQVGPPGNPLPLESK